MHARDDRTPPIGWTRLWAAARRFGGYPGRRVGVRARHSAAMRKLPISLAVVALLAAAVPATASAAPRKYTGKTSSGHKITFTVKRGRVRNLVAGIRMSCLNIQGGGFPLGGSEIFGFRGSVPLKRHVKFSFEGKPAFYYNEVTMNHDLWLKRHGRRRITGKMRLQYSFLIPTYPIGTFQVYSCLGGATFKAKARS